MRLRTRVDPVTLQIVGNALASMADEMATTICRTAHSTVVRDGMDFSAVVCDARGRTVAQALEGRSKVEWVRTADLRYGGQSWEVEVGFPAGAVDRGVLGALRARFEDEHQRLYGVKDQAGSPLEAAAFAPTSKERVAGASPSAVRRSARISTGEPA